MGSHPVTISCHYTVAHVTASGIHEHMDEEHSANHITVLTTDGDNHLVSSVFGKYS